MSTTVYNYTWAVVHKS